MTKNLIIYIAAILLVIGIYIYFADFTPPKEDNSEILKKISNLEQKIDSLSSKKDSIRTIILTVDKEIIKNEKYYEEVVNNIISQSDKSDSIFARDYIQKFIDQRVR